MFLRLDCGVNLRQSCKRLLTWDTTSFMAKRLLVKTYVFESLVLSIYMKLIDDVACWG